MCPGRLMLDFGGVDASLGSLDLLVTWPGGVILRDVVVPSVFGDEYIRDVPHGMLDVNVWSGAGEYVENESGLVIPLGSECPPVHKHSFIADTRGEIWRQEVELHKNYCCLTVKLKGEDVMPYSLVVSGNVDGYTLDGSPRKGEFRCVAYPEGEGEITVRVPRQIDASLMLEVEDDNGIRKLFAVGEYIKASGYDWDSENLGDVTVTLDYYITGITVLVQKWDEEFVYDLVL